MCLSCYLYIPRDNRHRIQFTVFNFPAGNLLNLDIDYYLGVIRTGATYIPAGKSPNLGVSHHLEVIGTRATYIPAVNLPNLGIRHHLEVNENRAYLHPSRELTQPWCDPSP